VAPFLFVAIGRGCTEHDHSMTMSRFAREEHSPISGSCGVEVVARAGHPAARASARRQKEFHVTARASISPSRRPVLGQPGRCRQPDAYCSVERPIDGRQAPDGRPMSKTASMPEGQSRQIQFTATTRNVLLRLRYPRCGRGTRSCPETHRGQGGYPAPTATASRPPAAARPAEPR